MSGTSVIPKPSSFQAMQTDLQVSMDDVVSAFVSQYESNLYARKKELTKEIKTLEDKLADINKVVLEKVTGESYKTTGLSFSLIVDVSEGSIEWENNEVAFTITISREGKGARYGNSLAFKERKKIPATQVKAYEKTTKELDALRSDLSEVLVALKSVSRKERQVRGRIAIRKLEDSGYASLMQDEELVRLVQLDE